MKIWCFLNSNPANRWRESCALWSSFPVAYFTKIFLGKLQESMGVGECFTRTWQELKKYGNLLL
jgi:hypothetical protein